MDMETIVILLICLIIYIPCACYYLLKERELQNLEDNNGHTNRWNNIVEIDIENNRDDKRDDNRDENIEDEVIEESPDAPQEVAVNPVQSLVYINRDSSVMTEVPINMNINKEFIDEEV
jgi:hypothetical protein